MKIQLSTMTEIGNGSVKEIAVVLTPGGPESFVFGAYTFSEETKQLVLLAIFSIVLTIFVGLVSFRFHRYRRKKAQGQWPITDEIFSKVERIGKG